MMMTEKLFQQDDLFVYTRLEHPVYPCSPLSLPGICSVPEDCSQESKKTILVISLYVLMNNLIFSHFILARSVYAKH